MAVSEASGLALLAAGSDYRSLWIACGLLLAAVLVVFVGVVLVRRWMLWSQPRQGEPFSLEELRQMHRRGDLSEEEYQRARDALAERLKGRLNPPRPAGPVGEAGDGQAGDPQEP